MNNTAIILKPVNQFTNFSEADHAVFEILPYLTELYEKRNELAQKEARKDNVIPLKRKTAFSQARCL